MNKLSLAFVGAMAFVSPCMAQTAFPGTQPQISRDYPGTTGAISSGQNNTGGDANVSVPLGATGADTIDTDSAVGGNANQPSRAVPQGSGGGASGGNN